jgi:hypothetical protein
LKTREPASTLRTVFSLCISGRKRSFDRHLPVGGSHTNFSRRMD